MNNPCVAWSISEQMKQQQQQRRRNSNYVYHDNDDSLLLSTSFDHNHVINSAAISNAEAQNNKLQNRCDFHLIDSRKEDLLELLSPYQQCSVNAKFVCNAIKPAKKKIEKGDLTNAFLSNKKIDTIETNCFGGDKSGDNNAVSTTQRNYKSCHRSISQPEMSKNEYTAGKK
eukprot:4419315-Ditylum_brightwellii.AAC.2